MRRLVRLSYLLAAAGLLTIWNLPYQADTTLQCGLVNQPAASLLLPYFEVDLGDAGGRNTMFSVGNTDAAPALAHAVVLTNWGHPVMSFDFFVPAGGVRSFNVRSLLQGHLPVTSPPAALPEGRFTGCATPLAQPTFDPAAVANLLTGRPHPVDGMCYAAAVEDGQLATGFITIDVVQDCSGASLVSTNDAGYFGDCATGLAANDNVLWGDFFLVDPKSDFAQGEKLVSLVADARKFGDPFTCVDPPCGGNRIFTTFYHQGSNRMPLAQTYEARFLRGGGFDGGTELIVWMDLGMGPAACGEPDTSPTLVTANARFRNEAGEEFGVYQIENVGQTFRVAVGGEHLPVTEGFGSVELSAHGLHQLVTPPLSEAIQLWVMPLVSGEGRFSVGLTTVPVADFCGAVW